MQRTSEQDRVGQWMRYAARKADLTGREIAERLGLKTHEAIYRWWAGDRAPKPHNLARYAEVVGEPVAYFYQPSDPPQLSRARVQQVVAVADQLLRGQGNLGEHRAALGASREEFREFLAARLGKDLDQMSASERREVLWELAEIVVARHPEPGPEPGRPDVKDPG